MDLKPLFGYKTLLNFFKKHIYKSVFFLIVGIVYYFSLPYVLFDQPTATLIESKKGELLAAKIADDMQWRFPEIDTVPIKFSQCIIQYEDAYFDRHWGFNPVSIYRAFVQNRKAGKIVRGGSTLTQQVIRLHRNGKQRNYREKLIELVLATRLEFRYSKKKILALYVSHAPFGGNTVGLEAASWRYFGLKASELSWAESATLAVLPNAPGLIHVNKNRNLLKEKRDALLDKLYAKQIIDSTTWLLSKIEPLPEKTFPLPQIAPHLLDQVMQTHKGKRVQTSIDIGLQKKINHLVKQHYDVLKQNHIYNAAVIVVDVRTRKVLAYVGNTPTDAAHEKDVDIIHKPRSTGSILKPFLFTSILNSGDILPSTLIPDIPTYINGYRPENYNLQYLGAVPANVALSKSLNIPAVRMLQTYGLGRFYNDLEKLKLTDINKGSTHYGLSLILGGAESSLWDLTRAYTTLSSTLNHYDATQGYYYSNEGQNLSIIQDEIPNFGNQKKEYTILDAGSIYATFQALLEVTRPSGEDNWEFFDQSRAIAWKTGTSFGFRDAWAIGVTPDYVVGVWVGNADGEGRPELTGLKTAAPLLFDSFKQLPQTNWFSIPYDEMRQVSVCSKSGHLASENCDQKDSIWVPVSGLKTKICPYHLKVHLDETAQFQVNTSCYPLEKMLHKNWFVLPPIQAYYYQMHQPFYKPLPAFKENCINKSKDILEILSPLQNEQIFLPKDFDENPTNLILKVKHAQADAKVYWYLNGVFKQETGYIHEVSWHLVRGTYTLSVVDDYGNEKTRIFKIL